MKENSASLVEWISRDNYFKKYGGECADPSESQNNGSIADFNLKEREQENKITIQFAEIKKSVLVPALDKKHIISPPLVETLWECPQEFSDAF